VKQGANERRSNGRPAAALDRRNRSMTASPLAIVGGCGHVGLPLGIAFARAGCVVDLIDVSADRIDLVNRGRMPFFEAGADRLLPELIRAGMLRATSDDSVIDNAAAVIVTIGTPAGSDLDLSGIHRIVPRLHAGQLLVLRSTVPAGTTNQLARDLHEAGRGDVDLAYCPERIVQGKSLEELNSLPQLVAGVTSRAARRAEVLFKLIARQIIHLRPIEAELAKLFCNAYRYIHFAISNQFYLAAQHHEADFYRIFYALRENYPRMQSFPRPGFAAGPCLVKDTKHLSANCDAFPLGEAALTVNGTFPQMLVNELRQKYPLGQWTVGILGMAFKPECDDPRDSLSYELRDLLEPVCQRVLCTDPYVLDPSLVGLDQVLDRADLLVVATPHACYRALKGRQPVFDVTDTLYNARSNAHLLRKFATARRSTTRNGRLIAARNGKAKQRKRA
jgi:UDP-N-acetyl-D-mannosaminuronic acid dehydrogenase